MCIRDSNSGVHIDGTVSANTAVYAGTGVDDGVISANTVNGAYQFLSFVGNSGALDTDNWQYPGTNGISNHTWGYEADGSGTSTGSSTISISRTKQMSGIILSAGTRIVGHLKLKNLLLSHQLIELIFSTYPNLSLIHI